MKNQLAYLHDGTFEGLLTSIYHAYYDKEDPVAILPEWMEGINFIYSYRKIHSEREKWEKVYKAVEEKISEASLRRIFNVYLSETEDSGIIILRYLREAFKVGREIDNHYTNSSVRELESVYSKVRIEVHRFLGLVRFKELPNGIFYSQIEPDNNITALLAPHFSQRLSTERWIIHDVKRGFAVFYKDGQWVIRQVEKFGEIQISEEEEHYQDLWREYYRSASIEGRRNTRQKKAYMPVRYWKNLIEEGE